MIQVESFDEVASAGDSAVILASVIAQAAAGAVYSCTPIAVWDGDGSIWCTEGPKVHVGGIAAREMDGTCRKGQATLRRCS